MADSYILDPDQLKAMQDALMSKYQVASDSSGVNQAMDNQATGNLTSNLGQALETAAKAQSMSRGGPGVNNQFWGDLRSQNQQSVQNAITQHQQAIQSAAQQASMAKDFNQEGIATQGAAQGAESHDQAMKKGAQDLAEGAVDLQKKKGDLKAQQTALTNLGNEQDPKSDASKMAQKILDTMEPGPDHSNVSAAQFKSLSPQYQDIYNKNIEMQVQKQKFETEAAVRQDSKQKEALQNTVQLLESARGNPAAAQAERDLYASDKANSLMNLYGDPNKLSMPQVRLLASEIGKIASGGSPSMHELEGLTPNTLSGKFSEVVSKLTNEPTPANAAAFVKQYKDYSDALSKDAKKVIEDKYGRVIESKKSVLKSDDYDQLKTQYVNRFNGPEDKAKSASSVAKPSWAE